jgi:N-acetyl-anhydromuramyl-L-alanine amidase AmpD
MFTPKNIIVHHSGGTDFNPMQDSSNYTVQQCNTDHKNRFKGLPSSLGWWVGYHYFIDKAGNVTQTRKDTEEGTHCIGYNNHPGNSESTYSVGICLAGNFDATLPTEAQIKSLTSLMASLVAKYNIPLANIVPHRTHANKTCYGKRLSDKWAADLLKVGSPKKYECVKGTVGGIIPEIQTFLRTNKYELTNFTPLIYDEAMCQAVLYFQLKNKLAPEDELATLRGEKIGPKTATALLKLINPVP